MNDLESTFREGLRQAVADRPGGVRVDVEEVIARASSPDFVPATGWTPPRWLAAAAAVLVVAGLGVGMAMLRPSAGLPAVPSAPSASAAPSTWFDAGTLVGTTWWAVQIDGRSVQTQGSATAPSLNFTSATQVVTSDGCNAGRRGYQLEPSGLILEFRFTAAGAQTEIGCNTAQQQRFTQALDAAVQARRSGDLLEFLDADQVVVLRLVRADPATSTPPPTEPVTVAISTPSSSTPASARSVTSGVRVRLYNDTGLTLRDVKVGFPEGVVITEATMAPGSYSEYLTPQLAYRLAGLEATADGRVYRSTPDDVLGEQPLQPGSYTFSIRLVEGVMFLEFGQD